MAAIQRRQGAVLKKEEEASHQDSVMQDIEEIRNAGFMSAVK